MAAKITYQIPIQNFELIRDQIAAILKLEMANQATLQTNPDLDPNVYTERFTPISKEEEKVLTVNLSNLELGQETQMSQKSDTVYFIDIYTFGKSDPTHMGYYNSSVKMQRLAGLVRAILEDPQYNKLDFPSTFIHRTSVFNILMDDGGRFEDGSNMRMCRVQFRVEHNEDQEVKTPIDLDGNDTIVKIEETEKGYKFILNT